MGPSQHQMAKELARKIDRVERLNTSPHLCQLKEKSHLGSWESRAGVPQSHSSTTLTAQKAAHQCASSSETRRLTGLGK